MKEMKRILALVLCFVMLVGLVPPAEALVPKQADKSYSGSALKLSGSVIDAAIFCSDVHGNPETVTSVFKGIQSMDSTFTPTTAAFVGDTQCVASSVTTAAQKVFSNVECIYAFGNHDDEKGNTSIPDFTGLSYGDEDTNYYIYTISESSMGSSNPDTTGFTTTVAGLDKTKPLFIVSHLPLHERRGDSNGAPAWYAAISAAAKEMDIFFFWAHNHTNESEVDRAAYYVPNDGTESMIIEYGDGEAVCPNFTYANAGYIDPPNTPKRNNVATAVYIYSDHVDLVVCNEDGVLTGNYAVDVTVDRLFADKETEETTPVVDRLEAVSNKETYYQGEELDLTVCEVYTNGDKVPVEGYIVSGYDSTVLGTQTVFVTYGNQSTTVAVKVVEMEAEAKLTGIRVTYSKESLLTGSLVLKVVAIYDNGVEVEVEDYTVTGYDPEKTGTQGVVVTYETASYGFNIAKSGNVTVLADGMNSVTVEDVTASLNETLAEVLKPGFVAYDITPDAYDVTNSLAVVSMPAPEGANAVFYWNEETQELEPVSDFVIVDGMATFTTNHFSKYVVGTSTEITVPDPLTATGSGTVTTTTEKPVYMLTNSISAGESYLIVNGNAAGSYYALANNGGSVAATGVTIKTDSENGTYIELTDAADELWTVAGRYTFACEDGYLYRASTQNTSTYIPRISDNSTTWSYNTSNHQLSYTRNNTTYYLRYNDGWYVDTSSANATSIYFYLPAEIEVETETDVSGTYSIASDEPKVTVVVVEGTKTYLDATLTFQPESGDATTTDVTQEATFSVADGGDPNGIIDVIEGDEVTFTGAYGTALVQISYETEFGTVTNYIEITASEPYYSVDILEGENVVTGTTISKKGVTSTTTLQLTTQVTQVTADEDIPLDTLPEGATITWNIPEEYHNIATVDENGKISFKGVDGAFYVTVTVTINGKDYMKGVNISATTSNYSVPNNGTSDFPEYPNEGAIRFDKTATAVGNFSQTGIAKVELSMTGVPYTTGSEIDVVLVLDMSTSMDDIIVEDDSSTTVDEEMDRRDVTIEAAKAFISKIVTNEDGTINGNRIAIYYFIGDEYRDVTAKRGLAAITDLDNDGDIDADDLDELLDAVDTISYESGNSGTHYAAGLEGAYNTLVTAKTDGVGNNRQQFCLFMSDGVPTEYQVTSSTQYSSTSNIQGMFATSNSSDSTKVYDTRDTDYKYEYYSTQMKANGVTVYSVGVGLYNTNGAWSGKTKYHCGNSGSLLLNDISGPAGETTQPDALGTTTLSKKDSYFFSVDDANAATELTKVFSNIAMKIKQAATDVTVEDKITNEYTMIFDVPKGDKTISLTDAQKDFYIEFGKYALDENHERTTFTSITKVYLTNSDNELSAQNATAPVFETKVIGEKGTLMYWTTDSSKGDTGVSVKSGETTYYFVSYGQEINADGTIPEGWYNMTSGTYAKGTVSAETNMSTDLIIATPYFVYNAGTKMIYWTVDKLDDQEYVLSYFLYLDNSATEVGTDNEVDAKTYPTNDHAYITYTNFKGSDCRQEFPIPRLTWNGAQVSYVFYLVNAAGQPINKSGQVVDFANATFITQVFTTEVVWNKDGDTSIGTDDLSANWLADDLLPQEYQIYDEKAHFALNVFENADGTTIKNEFTISGGTAAEISASLNNRLSLATTSDGVSVKTTKVFNTKAGTKIDTYGTYYSNTTTSIDFANTTVAFAVVWQPRLVEDVVVVDYGLDVLINVVQNDILQNELTGIGLGKEAYGSTDMNTGVSTTSKLGTGKLEIDGHSISIESKTEVRFSQNSMLFGTPIEFYYETPVKFWEGADSQVGYMYSKVTVIPATTIYYEDDFVEFTSYTNNVLDANCQWATTAQNGTQDQDRPGQSQIAEALDADNNYGYDSHYAEMSSHSFGSGAKITVNKNIRGEATFSFWGTGFDVISVTSGATGTIIVQVTDENNNVIRSTVVDTFYGMEEDGTLSANKPEALYQVPVIKIYGLDYGQYTVKLIAGWNDFFDHQENSAEYDLYLDAIRIYDPAGKNNETANEAYLADGEAFPLIQTLRDNVIKAEGVTVTKDEKGNVISVKFPDEDTLQEGAIFIDCNDAVNSIKDYVSYGPNNELYLAKGQAVAFNVTVNSNVADIQLGMKVANKDGVVTYKIGEKEFTLKSTTDMYYSIKEFAMDENGNSLTVVIKNTSDAILSLTNIKVTYESDPGSVANLLWMDGPSATYALMSLRKAPVVEEPAVPETTVPETTVPETTEPETTEPETTESETTEPEVTEPETTEPEVTEPETKPQEPERVEELIRIVKKIVRKIFGRIFG